jgi:cytochrome c oxidase subunit 3
MPSEISIEATDKTTLGTLLLTLSEGVFLAMLTFAYFFFQGQKPQVGPTAAGSLEPVWTGIFSAPLWATTYTSWRAMLNMRARSVDTAKRWSWLTVLLAFVFLCGQGKEWSDLADKRITIESGLFGTTYFMVTGFHDLHVFMGMVVSMIVLYVIARHGAGEGQIHAVTALWVYWTFMASFWVVIYTVVYLWSAVS